MSLANIKIKPTPKNIVSYDFPSVATLPAGIYTSYISAVEEAKTKNGEIAVDLLHDLKDAKGRMYHMRSRYKIDSIRFEELCDSLIAAGLSADESIEAAVGVKERILIQHNEGYAQISERTPL